MSITHALIGLYAAVAMTASAAVYAQPTSAPVVITLSRTPCLGSCPAYTLTITGDGQVTYVGKASVNVMGVQSLLDNGLLVVDADTR